MIFYKFLITSFRRGYTRCDAMVDDANVQTFKTIIRTRKYNYIYLWPKIMDQLDFDNESTFILFLNVINYFVGRRT
jgi:hypothetical protein